MARMAVGRTTHLTKEEVARETLALYDEGDFSMRSLGARLRVSPAAIYNHFENQSAVIVEAVALVWEEAATALMTEIADPIGQPGDPVEFLVLAATCARRAFIRHYRIATNLALPTPEADGRLSGTLAILGSLFESAGLEGQDAGDAFYAYLTYTLGSILYRTHRLADSERLGIDPEVRAFSSAAARPDDAPVVSPATLEGIDRTIGDAGSDEQAEERQFALGLRRLLEGFGVRGGAT